MGETSDARGDLMDFGSGTGIAGRGERRCDGWWARKESAVNQR